MKIKKFIDFLYDYTGQQLVKDKCSEVRKELLIQFTGCFYRALSPTEKQKYYKDLQYLIKQYLDKSVELEKAHKYVSEADKKKAKESSKEILKEAIDTLAKDPEKPYRTIVQDLATGMLDEEKITKETLLRNIKSWEEKYEDSFDYLIPTPLLDKIHNKK
jgi:hypothetical protein